MLRRPFVKMHYQDLTGFGEHIHDLIVSFQRCSSAVDLQPFFFGFTLATTTALIFGQPIKDYGSEAQHTFASSFDHASLISAIGRILPQSIASRAKLSKTMQLDSLNRLSRTSVTGLRNRKQSMLSFRISMTNIRIERLYAISW